MSKGSVLVTGSHRSGTTWVGRMLALSSAFEYVNEPFNVDHLHELVPHLFNNWYHYIPPDSRTDRRDDIQRVLDLRYLLRWHLMHAESGGNVYRHVRRAEHYPERARVGSLRAPERPSRPAVVRVDRRPVGPGGSYHGAPPSRFCRQSESQGMDVPDRRLAGAGSSDGRPSCTVRAHRNRDLRAHRTGRRRSGGPPLGGALHGRVDVSGPASGVDRSPPRRRGTTAGGHVGVVVLPLRPELHGLDSGRDQGTLRSFRASDDELRRNSRALVRNWERRLTPPEIKRVRSRTEPVASEIYSKNFWNCLWE